MASSSSANHMDVDDDPKGYQWESEYEKTWEALHENAEGLLQPKIDEMIDKGIRKRLLERYRKNLRLGMMRHVYVVVDMSENMHELDLKPNRISCSLRLLEMFFNEFFDQNPISQIGLIRTLNKRAQKVSDLCGNSKTHLESLKKLMDFSCEGEPSLQNSLELALSTLKNLPKHTSKEVLILFGSLTTCDPTDIHDTIESLASNNIRCSVIGLSAEVRICRTLAKATKGTYDVIMDETHYKDLIFQHLNPPPATANTESSLIRMGFPEYFNEGEGKPSICVCHMNGGSSSLSTSGYFCPQCHSKYCSLPVECQICGLTLVSSAHLARSYHHLFPVEMFEEVQDQVPKDQVRECFSCQSVVAPERRGAQCKQCLQLFCIDCDVFIHETLHLCPGCASLPVARSFNR